jgi:hypothetical protein
MATSTQKNPNDTITAADGGKYKIDKLTYPNDLIGKYQEYGESMILFNINVSTESKLSKGPETNYVNDYAPRDRGELIAAKYSTEKVVATTTAAGALQGTAVDAVTGGGGLAALANAGVSLAAAAQVAPKGGEFTRPQKRLATAIALHMPNQLQIRYGIQWQDKEMLTETVAVQTMGLGSVAAAAAGGGLAKLAGNSAAKGAGLGYAAYSMATQSDATTALSLQNIPGGEFLQAGSGIAVNPKKEQVFKGVDFRTFNINYEFYPRSLEEAKNVLNIIKLFKFHMHPEYKDGTTFLFIYPSEFDIFYYKGKGLNAAIHKHTSCVLTDLTVNYTPNGQFTTFPDGTPTQINIQMTFKELGILTKDKIEAGL